MSKVLPRLGVGGSEARIEAAWLTPVTVVEADGVCALIRWGNRKDARRREAMIMSCFVEESAALVKMIGVILAVLYGLMNLP